MHALLSALVISSAVSPWLKEGVSQNDGDARPMFVLVSFDATPRGHRPAEDYHFVRMLERVREAKPEHYEGPPPSFTLFYNTSLLQLRRDYTPPAGSPWVTDERWRAWLKSPEQPRSKVIGHARSPDAILQAVDTLFHLDTMGVELASHGVQHQNGKGWSREAWEREFDEHARIVSLFSLPKPLGFRAPFLKTSLAGKATLKDPLFQVMAKHEMRYDSSKVGRVEPEWPKRIETSDIWEVEVPMFEGPKGPALLFGPSSVGRWGLYFLLRDEFDRRYEGNRAPLIYGGHGEFYKGIERFMRSVCYLKDVRCVTYKSFVSHLDRTHRAKEHAKTPRWAHLALPWPQRSWPARLATNLRAALGMLTGG